MLVISRSILELAPFLAKDVSLNAGVVFDEARRTKA